MFKWRKQVREDETPDIYRIIPKAKIIPITDEPPEEGALVERFSVDLEERLKCNMGQVKEDATMLEKLINNKP